MFVCVHCPAQATMRIEVDGAWQNVCETHYVDHFRQESERNCEALGLMRKPGESAAAYRTRVSDWLKNRAQRLVKRPADARSL